MRRASRVVAVADVGRWRGASDTPVVPHRMTRIAWRERGEGVDRAARERRPAPAQPKAPPMSEAGRPSSTTKIAGKMNSTSGNRIFTGSFAAFSRAHCWRFEAHLRRPGLQHPTDRHPQGVRLRQRQHEVR